MNLTMMLGAIVSAVSLGQCLLAISLFLIRRDPHKIYGPLIVFFAAFSINLLTTSIEVFAPSTHGVFWYNLFEISSFVCLLTLAPALWIYLRNITTERRVSWQYKDLWHFFPFAIGVLVAIFLLSLPLDTIGQITDRFEGPKGHHLKIAAWALFLTMTFWAIQCSVYFLFVIKRLIQYQHRLKELFSSTENRELMWIYSVSFLLITSLTVSIINMFFSILDSVSFVVDIIDLALVYVLSHWGLRQQYPLVSSRPEEAEDATTAEAAQVASLEPPSVSNAKYERSALSEDHIDRIEARILATMENEKLFLNPNLSLGDLAKAVAEPPNYVSQTLNGRIGESFFDYINTLRVKEAQHYLCSGDKTVLDIAYEVGFNSRSSFYKSFKRETGMTPTAYRKKAASQ